PPAGSASRFHPPGSNAHGRDARPEALQPAVLRPSLFEVVFSFPIRVFSPRPPTVADIPGPRERHFGLRLRPRFDWPDSDEDGPRVDLILPASDSRREPA